jgi:hypothetical protein
MGERAPHRLACLMSLSRVDTALLGQLPVLRTPRNSYCTVRPFLRVSGVFTRCKKHEYLREKNEAMQALQMVCAAPRPGKERPQIPPLLPTSSHSFAIINETLIDCKVFFISAKHLCYKGLLCGNHTSVYKQKSRPVIQLIRLLAYSIARRKTPQHPASTSGPSQLPYFIHHPSHLRQPSVAHKPGHSIPRGVQSHCLGLQECPSQLGTFHQLSCYR